MILLILRRMGFAFSSFPPSTRWIRLFKKYFFKSLSSPIFNLSISLATSLSAMEDEKDLVIENLLDITKSISTMDYRCPIKKPYCNLARKLKFLTPLFEELKEMKDLIPDETFRALVSYKEALCCAKELLRFGNQGNRLYLVLEREQIMLKFQKVTTQLEHTLSRIPYDKLDISDEVKEQVDLVLAQFRRAEERTETLDVELYEDLLSVYDESCDPNKERAVLRKLTEKLQLMGTADLKQESLALYNMVVASDGVSGESIEKITMLQKKIKDFVLTENFGMGSHATATSLSKSGRWQYSIDTNSQPVVVPDDLRCPISLELMIDPVIVSTGQTYERACIKKWINTGHDTCPKTQQSLSSTVLTPNYALRSLIAQWCEVNGIEPPEQPVNPHPSKYSACTAAERANIDTLLRKLTSSNLEDPRSAAGELRLLAKRNTENRVCIAEAGAIPLLIGLLSAKDHRVQEHAVTTLLNLSICEDNKTRIIISGAIPGIVYVLRKGSMEARENAAATIFSLSVVDQYKVIIGTSGAIPALITLLSEGRHRGKKDAATALFNLCIYQGNKARSVRAGIVPTLIRLLTQTEGGMVDEVLSILYILASHPDGKTAIRAAEAVPILVDVIGSGTPRNRENAAAVLVHLSVGDEQHLAEAKELGLMQLLLDMVQNGTEGQAQGDTAARTAKQICRAAEACPATT